MGCNKCKQNPCVCDQNKGKQVLIEDATMAAFGFDNQAEVRVPKK